MRENPKDARLDIHVLVSENTPKEWLTQCLDSIQVAIGNAPFPIALHVIPAVPGHMGKARHAGYSCGTAPYVTQVDDDDYVEPKAFARLAEHMDAGIEAIFPRERTLQNGKFCLGRQRHSMKVFRRELLIDHSPWRHTSDQRQLDRLTRGVGVSCVDITEPCYVYRLHFSLARKLRHAYPDELENPT
jgi:hypothetical protein